MEQVWLTEQQILPVTFSIDCVETTGSNYANYMNDSSTNETNAMIDILENVVIILGPSNQSNV